MSKTNFRMDVAGTITKRLGTQLIPNNGVGLSEIIKNSYDADATKVQIQLVGAFGDNPDDCFIVIQDEGVGMNKADLQKKLFNIASEHKRGTRTPKGRWVLGEKGIGRFAVERMAHELILYTKKEGAPEWKIEVNWDLFETAKEVSDVEMPGTTDHSDKAFTSDQHGTILVMQKLREKFDGNSMQEVKRTVGLLVSPFSDMNDFDLEVNVPPEFEYHQFMDVVSMSREIADKCHFSCRALLDGTGRVQFDYVCNHPWSPAEGREEKGSWEAVDLIGRNPKIKDVWFNFHVFQRTAALLKDTGVTRSDLDQVVGVRLYRDGLRVWPYGDIISRIKKRDKKGKVDVDDWLGLTAQRMQDPTNWVGHDQVIGAIEISQEANPELQDKTDRHGLVENQEFEDLRDISTKIIGKFTRIYIKHDKRQTAPKKPDPPGTQSMISVFETGSGPSPEARTGTVPANVPEIPEAPTASFVVEQLPEDLAIARKNVREATASLNRVMATLKLDRDYIIEAIEEAESSLTEAREALED